MPASSTNHQDYGELNDNTVGHALWVGSLVGIPTLYVIVAAISMAATASLTESLLIAAWAAIVGGPFFGALFGLGSLVHADERRAALVKRPVTVGRRTTPARPA